MDASGQYILLGAPLSGGEFRDAGFLRRQPANSTARRTLSTVDMNHCDTFLSMGADASGLYYYNNEDRQIEFRPSGAPFDPLQVVMPTPNGVYDGRSIKPYDEFLYWISGDNTIQRARRRRAGQELLANTAINATGLNVITVFNVFCILCLSFPTGARIPAKIVVLTSTVSPDQGEKKMPILANYHHFAGRHWETGTVHNYYAYRGIKAPHTGQPYSEALLMGVSGGAVMGYFSFAYEGHDPHVALLTRNTFDPLNTMLARLGIVQEVRQTSKPEKGVANLVDTLADGLPALVWADMWSLPYNALIDEGGMWVMFPILVYGYDEAAAQVWIADRASVPLTVTTHELAAARGRVKQDKYRILTLDQPDPEKLPAAVTAGIWDCINLYTEKPPKGSANNFGLKAFRWWADLLTKPKQRMSWEKEFPVGVKLYAGLTSTFSRLGAVGINGDADRALYATFLEEASVILNKLALQEVAHQFRASGQAWRALGRLLLPDSVPALQETRTLLERKAQLFVEQGGATVAEREQINAQLQAIRASMRTDFPLSAAEVVTLREQISMQVLHIRDLEEAAIYQLRAIMA